MDVFKRFASILLDIFSKVMPGGLFILVFRNKDDLPPELLLRDLFGFGDSAPPERQGCSSSSSRKARSLSASERL